MHSSVALQVHGLLQLQYNSTVQNGFANGGITFSDTVVMIRAECKEVNNQTDKPL